MGHGIPPSRALTIAALGVFHPALDGRALVDVCDHAAAFHCQAARIVPAASRTGADALTPDAIEDAPPGASMSPRDLLAAYRVPPGTRANGAIVAIVDMPDPDALEDVNVYRAQYGIPALPRCAGAPRGTTPCFAVVDQAGNLDPKGLPDSEGADVETSVDMDMISAACPDCSILLVEFTRPDGPTAEDFVTATRTAASLGAVATGISWGGAEAAGMPTGFTQAGRMLVVAATGDAGYMRESHAGGDPAQLAATYPASAPDVLAVGGTTLQLRGGVFTHTVWASWVGASSSGCSRAFDMPPFQSTFVTTHPEAFGACVMRATNDLAAAADYSSAPGNFGGIAAYTSSQGGWTATTGTSAAAEQVAAILARLGLAVPISRDLGFVYRHAGAFEDVTEGSNDEGGMCKDAVLCTAGPGWDGPTGVGTPDGAELASLAQLVDDAGSTPSGSRSQAGCTTATPPRQEAGGDACAPFAAGLALAAATAKICRRRSVCPLGCATISR
jgi:hypothetical protein